MKRIAIGLDVGGTRIKHAVVEGGSCGPWKLREVAEVPTPRGPGRERAAVGVLKAVIAQYQRRFSAAVRVGLGIPGLVESSRGVVLHCPNLGWNDLPLASMLAPVVARERLVMGNDATVAALGIHSYEFCGRYRTMVVLTLGTGVGGGLVFDGKVYVGSRGFAGELGHITIDPAGSMCSCGNRGCLERLIGGRWLAQDAADEIRRRGMSPVLRRLTDGDVSALSPELLCKAADHGDRFSRAIWKRCGMRLGTAVAALVNVLDPDAVVLTGGVASAHRWFMPSCIAELRRRSFPRIARTPAGMRAPAACVKVLVSRNPRHLGVIGAGILAHTSRP